MKNTLVQYKGGCYEGCYWEYNFFLYDNEGKFHNLYSSGIYGCKTEQEAQQVVNQQGPYIEKGDVEFIDITDEKQIDKFQSENNVGFVIKVVQKINKIYGENKIWCTCDFCGEKIYTGGEVEGFRGAGGIQIIATQKICDSCYSLHTCGYCGEFWEEIKDVDKCHPEYDN